MDNLELLERLRTVDPPDLAISARVVATIEGAIAGEESRPAVIAPPDGGSSVEPWVVTANGTSGSRSMPVRHRHRRRMALVIASITTLAVASAVVLPAVFSNSPPTNTKPTSTPPTHARHTPQFQLVDSTEFPFRVASGGLNPVQLDCPTTTVCYASMDGDGAPLEKSTDGGATWTPTAAPPLATVSTSLDESSCASATVCALTLGAATSTPNAAFVLTTDGGATWATIPVPMPSSVPGGSVDHVACVDPSQCVVHVSGTRAGSTAQNPVAPVGSTPQTTAPPVGSTPRNAELPIGTFLSTTDGGATWSTSTLPVSTPGGIWALRCATNGTCLAITMPGSVTGPNGDTLSLKALRSTDFGATWTAGTASGVQPGSGVFLLSCGDTTHCLVAYPPSKAGEKGFKVATTSDGGVTWHVAPAPTDAGNIAVGVSCDSTGECWLSSSTYGGVKVVRDGKDVAQVGYSDPVVATTSDGGATWAAVGVPASANGAPMGVVGPLSCSGDGTCIAVGTNEWAYGPPTGMSPSAYGKKLATSRVILAARRSAPSAAS